MLGRVGNAAGAEVVVVGAGPAGSATATLLARHGHDVVLLDQARFPRPKPCAEYASPGAARLLERLGLGCHGGRWLRGMRLVAPNGTSTVLGYGDAQALSIPRTELDAQLVELARSHGVAVRENVRVGGPLIEDGAVSGVTGPDLRLRARFVVGADGQHSSLVRGLRLARRLRWPPRLGLVAHLRGVPWPEDIGQMWVGTNAYVGVAPVTEDVVTVGLVTNLPRGRLGQSASALWHALAQFPLVKQRLAGAALDEPVRGVGPLTHAVRAASGPGFLLVGDAAGFFDPFTGEGLYRALRGAELAADAVHAELSGRPGKSYERARRQAFRAKERLTALIQLFVRVPWLMNYAVARLERRPRLALALGRVLGDLAPAEMTIRPEYLWALLRP